MNNRNTTSAAGRLVAAATALLLTVGVPTTVNGVAAQIGTRVQRSELRSSVNEAAKMAMRPSQFNAAASTLPIADIASLGNGPTAYHHCAVEKRGTLLCWGDNDYGQLGIPDSASGNATFTDWLTPTRLAGLTDVVQVAMGRRHTCAVLGDGGVQCWGSNGGDGRLGMGNFDSTDVPTPTDVLVAAGGARMTGASSVALGEWHSCAVMVDGTVRCWGDNSFGILGVGDTTDRDVPVTVTNLSDIKQVAVGNGHSCALSNAGYVYCWGKKASLGDGLNVDSMVPVTVLASAGGAPLGDIVSIHSGNRHVCARNSLGEVRCWGANQNLDPWAGTGIAAAALMPTVTLRSEDGAPLTGVTAHSTGQVHSCFLLADATVRCAGNNGDGQLGDGTTNNSAWPITVTITGTEPLTQVVEVASGFNTNCMRQTSGDVYCWGMNWDGTVGDGTTDLRLQPVHVIRGATPKTLKALAVGDNPDVPAAFAPSEFVSTTLNYTVTLPYTSTALHVLGSATDIAAHPNLILTFESSNGSAGPSTYGLYSQPQLGEIFLGSWPMTEGLTGTILITSYDRYSAEFALYTVFVDRTIPPSDDASLADLEIHPGELSPAFVSTTRAYAAEVPNGTTTAAVTATTSDVSATVAYASTAGACTPGNASPSDCAIDASGTTTITITITAPDLTTTETYTIVVTVADAPTPTPTPSVTPSPTASPTPSPTPTGTPAPLTTISLVWPNLGVPDGGMPVALFGTGFNAATGVRVSNTITNTLVPFTITSDGRIDFVMPAGVDGTYADITVETASDSQTAEDAFRYMAPKGLQFEGNAGGVITTPNGITITIPPQGVSGMFVVTITPQTPEPGVPGSLLMHVFRLDALLNWEPLASLTNPITIALPVDPAIVPEGETPYLWEWIAATGRLQTADGGRRTADDGHWEYVQGQSYDAATKQVTVGLKPMGLYALSTSILAGRSYWFPLVPAVREKK